jgi:hypothetical protein
MNVFSFVGRAQRLVVKRNEQIRKAVEESNGGEYTSIRHVLDSVLDDVSRRSYNQYLTDWFNETVNKPIKSKVEGTGSNDTLEAIEEPKPSFLDFFRSELDDGSAFASFRVNYTGAVQESFSNQTAESEMASTINNMSSSARTTTFKFAGGNIDDGIIGSAIGSALQSARDFANGVADSIGIQGLATLAGAAFVDIPEQWTASVARLPTLNYTIHLGGPYGNQISQLMDIDLPIAMLLAGALPRATGKQSYTSPFLLELYDQGRGQTRLGIIESISINRGTTNLGFNKECKAMGVEISLGIKDLSTVVTVPITKGISHDALASGINAGWIGMTAAGAVGGAVAGAKAGGLGGAIVGAVGGTVVSQIAALPAAVGFGAVGAGVDAVKNVITTINNVFDDDNTFTDYMAVLAGMNMYEQIYMWPRFRNNIARAMASWDTMYSASAFASFMGDTIPARVLSIMYKGTIK